MNPRQEAAAKKFAASNKVFLISCGWTAEEATAEVTFDQVSPKSFQITLINRRADGFTTMRLARVGLRGGISRDRATHHI